MFWNSLRAGEPHAHIFTALFERQSKSFHEKICLTLCHILSSIQEIGHCLDVTERKHTCDQPSSLCEWFSADIPVGERLRGSSAPSCRDCGNAINRTDTAMIGWLKQGAAYVHISFHSYIACSLRYQRVTNHLGGSSQFQYRSLWTHGPTQA